MKISNAILGTVILSIIIYFIYKKNNIEAMYVGSEYDGKMYLVRNQENKEGSAYILSKIKKNLFDLRDYLISNKTKYDEENRQYIKNLEDRMNGMIISENTKNESFTSYTVNKGEEMLFCLRSKETGKLHDFNLLMYVAIHELGHVACPEEGHTPLFNKIFAFLLNEAINIGLYRYEDYRMNPVEYCGMTVNQSIVTR